MGHELDMEIRRKRKSKKGKGMYKISKVMEEFKRGELRSGKGGIVRNRKQAVAIALSEARSAGARIPRR